MKEKLSRGIARYLQSLIDETRGWTATRLGREIGVDQQLMSNRLLGKTPFTLDELEAIVEAMPGLTWPALLAGGEKMREPLLPLSDASADFRTKEDEALEAARTANAKRAVAARRAVRKATPPASA